MALSNGFDYAAVLPVLRDRTGWRSDSSPAPLRTFESFHALVTEQNLRDTQPTENISDPNWITLKAQIKDDVIIRCLSSVFNQPENIDQVLLHDRVLPSVTIPISNQNLFCGIRFKVAQDFGISVQVKSVTLLFDQSITFNLYLFRDGDPTAIDTISVTTVANEPTVLNMDQLELLSYAKWGSVNYFLGYFQSDIGTAHALRELVSPNCAKAFSAQPFQSPKKGSSMDFAAVAWNTYDTFGMNAEVHSYRDYTYRIINNPQLFDEAIGLSMVYYVIEQILSCTRSNSTQRVLGDVTDKIMLQHYLYGSVPAMGTPKTTGLNEILQKKFCEIRESFYPRPKAQTVSLCPS